MSSLWNHEPKPNVRWHGRSTFFNYTNLRAVIFQHFVHEDIMCVAQSGAGTFVTHQLVADSGLDMRNYDPLRFSTGSGAIFLDGKFISYLFSTCRYADINDPLHIKQYARKTVVEYTRPRVPKLDLDQVMTP
ncbi:hypothetical protein BDZ91DRAFT_565081 [Kalaharituber pfeilii]|nr:hypothetical protein BDZ91DRAFT_565081 [Kalaharituber pfeilii]